MNGATGEGVGGARRPAKHSEQLATLFRRQIEVSWMKGEKVKRGIN